MTTAFHVWLYGGFMDIQSTFRRKKLHRTNQGSNFLGGTFSNRENVRAPSRFKTKVNPSNLKDKFSSKTDPFTFTSIAPVLLDVIRPVKQTSQLFPALKSTNHFLPQSTVSPRSDSISEANCSCCNRSDAWLHLEYRVVSSGKIVILQITSSGRSLMTLEELQH